MWWRWPASAERRDEMRLRDDRRRTTIACQQIETPSRTKCMITDRKDATNQATLFIVGPEDTRSRITASLTNLNGIFQPWRRRAGQIVNYKFPFFVQRLAVIRCCRLANVDKPQSWQCYFCILTEKFGNWSPTKSKSDVPCFFLNVSKNSLIFFSDHADRRTRTVRLMEAKTLSPFAEAEGADCNTARLGFRPLNRIDLTPSENNVNPLDSIKMSGKWTIT